MKGRPGSVRSLTWVRLTRLARLPGRHFPMCLYEKFYPGFLDEKIKAKDPKANMAKNKKFNFRAYHSFGNS